MHRVNNDTSEITGSIQLNGRDRRPLYQQLADGIADLIRDGDLAPGARLPSLRAIAKSHGVALVTATQAYELLVAEGLLESRTGRGSFVTSNGAVLGSQVPIPSSALPQRGVRSITPVASVREPDSTVKGLALKSRRFAAMDLLRSNVRPGSIILSAGHTAPETYPLPDFAQCFARTFLDDPPSIHQYRVDRGDESLREVCAQRLRARGADVSADDILIVSGAQQALSLVAQSFVQDGDVVAAEAPTYFSALETFDQRRVSWVNLALDADGIVPDALAEAVRKYMPRLVYTNSAAQNPTGAFLSRSRHRQILTLAERSNMFIVEDQTCWQLAYDHEAPPPLFASDKSGRVILMESFSKMLFPSLRVGFIAAKGAAMQTLYDAKLRADSFTTTVAQRALVRFLNSKAPARHLRATRALYRSRRDALHEAMLRVLPDGAHGVKPVGGLNMWIELPAHWSARDFLSYAAAEGLLFLPGVPFYPTSPEYNTLRLSYGALPERDAPEAAARFGRAVRNYSAALKKRTASVMGDPAVSPAV